jgi:hypothetical protein
MLTLLQTTRLTLTGKILKFLLFSKTLLHGNAVTMVQSLREQALLYLRISALLTLALLALSFLKLKALSMDTQWCKAEQSLVTQD